MIGLRAQTAPSMIQPLKEKDQSWRPPQNAAIIMHLNCMLLLCSGAGGLVVRAFD